MPFEKLNKRIDGNIGSQQSSRSISFIERMARQRDAEKLRVKTVIENIASSSEGAKAESSAVLRERDGKTAPGSEISLTAQGGLGGMENENERKARHDRETQHFTQRLVREIRDANDNNIDEVLERQQKEIAEFQQRHQNDTDRANRVKEYNSARERRQDRG